MKKLISILLTVAILITMSSVALAIPDTLKDIDSSMISGADDAVEKVLGALQWIGYAFAIGMLIYIGIKYTMSAANEKADLKKGLINYVIGAVLIAGAATICGWITDFGDDLGGGTEGDKKKSGEEKKSSYQYEEVLSNEFYV